jgi:2-polyprenyl-3-methyl-5-hydroxy-6-metoxy-1,4-benzoquinol methylase
MNQDVLEKEYQDLNNIAAVYDYDDFDRDIRHYMIRAMEPFLVPGRALEMGCAYGEFTEILSQHYDDLTVIDAAEEFLDHTRNRLGNKAQYILSLFETYEPKEEEKYDAIFIMHTLEHLIDPVDTMRRAKSWLTPKGRLYLVVPNANAASRQLAVKMGLLSHNWALTEKDHKHGHRIYYSFDTFERDAREAGLDIVHRGGIFFKPLANFQIDLALKHGVINREYMEACFQLGYIYPDLCNSLLLIGK